MTFHLVGSVPLGGFNVAANASIGALAPALAQFDLMLYGPNGLGATAADLALSFNASIDVTLGLGLQVQNPLVNIQLTLSALAQVQAALTASLNISIPTIQITAQLQANASLQAALGVQLGGIQALIAAALAVKLPAVDFLTSLTANLSAGPVVIGSWGFADPPDTLFNTGAEIEAAFAGGIGGILPTDAVYGVLIVTNSVSASTAISATLLVE